MGSPNQEEQEESLRDDENMYVDNVRVLVLAINF